MPPLFPYPTVLEFSGLLAHKRYHPTKVILYKNMDVTQKFAITVYKDLTDPRNFNNIINFDSSNDLAI